MLSESPCCARNGTGSKAELDSDHAEQDALNGQLGMAAVGTAAPDLIDDDISRTRAELIKARTDHDEASAKYSAMEAGKGDSSSAIDAEADELVAADAGPDQHEDIAQSAPRHADYSDGKSEAGQPRIQAGRGGTGQDQRHLRFHDEGSARPKRLSASKCACAPTCSAPVESRRS